MCKNALTVSLKSSVHVSCIAWIVTRLYRNLLGYPGPLKQVIFTSKYSDNFDQNEIITMMNNVDGIYVKYDLFEGARVSQKGSIQSGDYPSYTRHMNG